MGRSRNGWLVFARVLFSLAAGVVASDAGAQGVSELRGVVVSGDASPVSGASVTLVGSGQVARTVVTADDGVFLFTGLAAGSASVRARRIGFRAESLSVTLPTIDGAPLRIRLDVVPQALAKVVVKGRPELRPGPIADFYHRKENGFGRYITRADIERQRPTRTTDLLRMVPGVTLFRSGGMLDFRIRGNSCAPEVFIDGTPLGPQPMDLDAITPYTIEGIEIYASGATVPVEYVRSFGRSSCGTLMLWTREGEPAPKREKRAKPVTSAELARLVDGLQLFTAEQVDTAAVLEEDFLDLVRLPDSLRAWTEPAGVIVEFVVDAAGEVEPGTSNVVASPGAAFADAVRAALPSAKFRPARRGGQAVRQLVQLSVRFDPPAGRRR